MNIEEKIAILSQHITENRLHKMQYALEYRMRKLVIVLEDIFQSHNAAAVLRSCDAFGLQEVHAIENRYVLDISNNVDMGASKWIDLVHHKTSEARKRRTNMQKVHTLSPMAKQNTIDTLQSLKNKGYLLVASSLRDDALTLDDVPTDKPLALMIGTELTGLSKEAHDLADVSFKMPMMGFAQSFNLSVFSALCISKLTEKIRAEGDDWKLSKEDKNQITLSWLYKCVSNANHIVGA